MNTLSFFAGFITKLVRTITFSRVLVWSFTAVTVMSLYTFYENRAKLLAYFTAPDVTSMVGVTFTVGQETQSQIQTIVNGDPRIAGIAVMSTDLRFNEAKSVFFYGNEPTLRQVYDQAARAGSDRLPLFTSNDENNAGIIKLINGQFTCVKFETTLMARIYPELRNTIKALCRSSIPSYYGYFSGYVSAFMLEVPNPERELQYKLIIEKLANDVYFRDVLTTQRPEKIIKSNQGLIP